MAIPKKIHYCWFGEKPIPQEYQNYIASWKIKCFDYEIKEWNESNFDIHCCEYVEQAYNSKKWAFVSDYVRLYALVSEGGIYMDTDVEVLKPLDIFLTNEAFSGFEKKDAIPTGIMACEKNFNLFRHLLNDYNKRSFINEDGSLDLTTNVDTITKCCMQYGLNLNNSKQIVQGLTLYPNEYFCPKNYNTGVIEITQNTFTIHHFASSWHSSQEIKSHILAQKIRKIFGAKIGNAAESFISFSYKFKARRKELGFIGAFVWALKKIKKKILK